MGMNLSNYDSVLKDVYGPRIEEALSMANVLSDVIEENDSEDWTGRQVVYPEHVGRNQGVGAAAEGKRLPKAGQQKYATVKIPSKYNYIRIELTKQVLDASEQNKGAFSRAMDTELNGAVRDLANDRERQFFGAGKGVLALVNGTISNSTTVTVDSPYGVTPTTNGARFLSPDMTLVGIDPATDTTIEDTFTVVSIAADGNSIVVDTATTLSNNARIVRWNPDVADGSENNLNNECMGLLGLIDDGTYVNTLHNINRTTFPVFKAPVIASVGQLSLDVIQRGIDATDELGGGNIAQDGCIVVHHSVRREYLKLLQADRRYTGADLKTPDGGTKQAALKRGGEITYGDIPWKTAKHCPYGSIFGFIKNTIVRYIQIRGEWADEDGAILRNVVGFDKWEAFYRIWENLAIKRATDSFRLDGITATVSINHIF